jgi:hypothetical protein
MSLHGSVSSPLGSQRRDRSRSEDVQKVVLCDDDDEELPTGPALPVAGHDRSYLAIKLSVDCTLGGVVGLPAPCAMSREHVYPRQALGHGTQRFAHSWLAYAATTKVFLNHCLSGAVGFAYGVKVLNKTWHAVWQGGFLCWNTVLDYHFCAHYR